MTSRKDSTKAAIDRYYSKLLVEQSPKAKEKRLTPELDLQKEIHSWLLSSGFFAFRVESRAQFDQATGNTIYSQTTVGVSDEIAVHNTGLFCAVEIKAPGKRSTLRDSQRNFLHSVIASNGFAACVDSVEHLSSLWTSYNSLDLSLRKSLLLRDLPQLKICNKPLFDESKTE